MTMNGFGEFAAFAGMGQTVGPQLPYDLASSTWETMSPEEQAHLSQASASGLTWEAAVESFFNPAIAAGGQPAGQPPAQLISGVSNTTLLIGAAALVFALVLMRQ